METLIDKPLKSIWLKASVIGSFWASIEIILGSFLHNLRIPLTGTILSFISVYMLISFLQVWKENGLIIRAGLVCALMKSISPSAIILGPMIGIITEAVLLEFFIFLLGKNLLGYMIGGAFAVLSALIHKLASLLILYGLNFIKILSSLFTYSVKQNNISNIDHIGISTFYYPESILLQAFPQLLQDTFPEINILNTGNPLLSSRISDFNQIINCSLRPQTKNTLYIT